MVDGWRGWRVFADYHTHSVYSHGRGSVLDNARAAAARGLEAVAIADHGPRSVPWVGVDSPRAYDRVRADAQRASAAAGVEVLTAAECDVVTIDGRLDLEPRDLGKLDLVLVGLHLLVIPPTVGDATRLLLPNLPPWRWSRRTRAKARVANTKALAEAVSRYRVAFVTHPGLHLSVDTPELARVCARRGTRMEISSAHRETDEAYVRAAAREGADFVLSSDAHRPERVGDLAAALHVAKRAGLSPDRVWNVRPAAGLRC